MTKNEIIKILKRDLKFEESAKTGCEELLTFPESQPHQDIIKQIQKDEMKHIALTKKLINIIENK